MSGETITAARSFMPYADATYDYYCYAPPRTELTVAHWRVSRIHKTSLREQWAASSDGDMNTNLATDLATVAALDFV